MPRHRESLYKTSETHGQLCQRIKGLCESFILGEISKLEYPTTKAATLKQRNAAHVRIVKLEATLENMGMDGNLQNGFVSTFGKYSEVEVISSKIQ